MIDLYGRSRHPEHPDAEALDEETYTARRKRAQLMLKTYEKIPDGIPPDTRYVLIDEDKFDEMEPGKLSGTVVIPRWGGLSQFHRIVDLEGRIIDVANWENVSQIDEVLSNIFGVEPGL